MRKKMCRKTAQDLPSGECDICGKRISRNKIFPLCDKCMRASDILNECPICETQFNYETFFNQFKKDIKLPEMWMDEESEIICPKCMQFRDTPITFDVMKD